VTSLVRSLFRVLSSLKTSDDIEQNNESSMLSSRSMFVGGIDFDSDDNDGIDGDDRDEFVDDNLKAI